MAKTEKCAARVKLFFLLIRPIVVLVVLFFLLFSIPSPSCALHDFIFVLVNYKFSTV